MSNYKPQKGDRVRVVLEDEVRGVESDGFVVGDAADANYIQPGAEHVVSIEKIEPPVEVFKPGDVVRSKDHPELVYLLDGEDGYSVFQYGKGGLVYHGANNRRFTSRRYERVELA